MAKFSEAELAQVLQLKVDSGEIDKIRADEVMKSFKLSKMPEGNLIDTIWEPTKAIASSLLGQVAAGSAGVLTLATGGGVDKASKNIKGIQDTAAEIAEPQTQAGVKGLEKVSDLVQLGVDVTQFTVSGLAGITALVSGKSLNESVAIMESIKTKGVGATAGDITLKETGSPLMATAAFMSPELVGSIIPIVGAINKSSKFQRSISARLKDGQASPQAGREIAIFQSKLKNGELPPDLMAEFDRLIAGSPPRIQKQLIEVAEDVVVGVDKKAIANKLNEVANDASRAAADTTIVDYIKRGANGIKTDGLARETIKQGFDQGVIASVKAATPLDRSKMLKMMDTLERGKKDALFGTRNRPSDIAGDTLLDRIKYIKSVNREAGSELDGIAKGLKGQPVEFGDVTNNFITRLDDMGVKLDENLKPMFQGSDIEGVTAAENVINKIVKRMSTGGVPDAHDLHRMKKFIDEQVTYGKSAEGLAGKTERVLKDLRREIDGALDSQFPEYDRVNTAYADTVGALDSLQGSVGKKMDLFGDNADKAIGTVLRRLMSNTQSRVNLMDAVDDIEAVTRRYGGLFDDNVQVQVLFADEIDSVMGPVARTAFTNSIAKGVTKGLQVSTGQKTGLGMLAEAAGAVADKAKGINEANAIKSIRKLLERK